MENAKVRVMNFLDENETPFWSAQFIVPVISPSGNPVHALRKQVDCLPINRKYQIDKNLSVKIIRRKNRDRLVVDDGGDVQESDLINPKYATEFIISVKPRRRRKSDDDARYVFI